MLKVQLQAKTPRSVSPIIFSLFTPSCYSTPFSDISIFQWCAHHPVIENAYDAARQSATARPIVQIDDPETDGARCQLDRHNARMYGWLLRNGVIAVTSGDHQWSASFSLARVRRVHVETFDRRLLIARRISVCSDSLARVDLDYRTGERRLQRFRGSMIDTRVRNVRSTVKIRRFLVLNGIVFRW